MNTKVIGLRRLAFGVSALAIGAVSVLPALAGTASAAQVTSRKIVMSTSAVSATNTTYNVIFNPGTATTVGGIVVDFCASNPIVGDTSCTLPAGFTLGTTPAITVNSGMGTGWTVAGLQGAAAASNFQAIKLSHATPQALATGTPVNFTINTVTNPSTVNTTFYARIVTFDTAANMDSQYTATGATRAATFANMVDYGGVALSTAAVINETAIVQETLTFCVYTGANCGAGGTAVNLGDANGVLASTTTQYTGTAKYDLGSNAQSGVLVRMKGDTLKSGSFSISSSGATCTADSTASGVEQFGMRLSTVGAGQLATAPYDCTAGNHSFDVTTPCAANEGNVTCTYGEQIASTAGATDSTTTTMEYTAKAATTTEAGIYTAALNYIATGTY